MVEVGRTDMTHAARSNVRSGARSVAGYAARGLTWPPSPHWPARTAATRSGLRTRAVAAHLRGSLRAAPSTSSPMESNYDSALIECAAAANVSRRRRLHLSQELTRRGLVLVPQVDGALIVRGVLPADMVAIVGAAEVIPTASRCRAGSRQELALRGASVVSGGARGATRGRTWAQWTSVRQDRRGAARWARSSLSRHHAALFRAGGRDWRRDRVRYVWPAGDDHGSASPAQP